MALFPQYDEIPYLPGVKITPRFSTSISSLSGGQEKRRAKFTFPLYDLEISYDMLTLENARTIWQFYKDRQGSYGAFYFYVPYSDTYEGEYVGTGDGSTTQFDVPGKTVSSYTVYIDGTEKTEGGGDDYTLAQSAGVEGAAQLTFASAPAVGEQISVDFTGYYRFKVRFAEDNLPFDVFYQNLIRLGISLVGVR
jgi:hypothetical protein